MADAIRTDSVRFTYRQATEPSLNGVDYAQPEGTFACIIGPTGAGKSTFLRTLNRIVPGFFKGEFEGNVRLLGESIEGVRTAKLAGRIGMVFQDFESQIFSTDALLEVAFGPENAAVDPAEIRRRVSESLARVGLAGFEGRDTAAMSGGEKQRLAIAAVLSMDPAVLVLDEPTTDLDPAGKREVLDVVRALADAGHTVLLVEHDCEEILAADSVHLMDGGRIVREGPAIDVLAAVDDLAARGVRPPEMASVCARLGLAADSLAVEDVAREIERRGFAFDDAKVERLLAAEAARPAGDEVLRVEGLSFAYGDCAVLDGVDLSFRRGEIAAILGRNGAGKTTLVKALNGLHRPRAGRVLLDGEDTAAMTVSQLGRRVGFVFQNPDHQIFSATCHEEVEFGLVNHAVCGQDRASAVASALAAVNLTGYDDRDPYVLTKGERQRLAVASVLACKPDVIVLDEPTTGLDYGEQRAMMDLLVRLADAGHAVVIVTHTMWVVAAYCRRAILMEAGTVIADGPVRDVFADDQALSAARVIPPPAVRLAAQFGRRLLTVDEIASCLSGEGA